MSFVVQVKQIWQALPLPVSSAIVSVVTFVGLAMLRYLTQTNPQVLTWAGLGGSLLAGLASWADSYVRLIQVPPEK